MRVTGKEFVEKITPIFEGNTRNNLAHLQVCFLDSLPKLLEQMAELNVESLEPWICYSVEIGKIQVIVTPTGAEPQDEDISFYSSQMEVYQQILH